MPFCSNLNRIIGGDISSLSGMNGPFLLIVKTAVFTTLGKSTECRPAPSCSNLSGLIGGNLSCRVERVGSSLRNLDGCWESGCENNRVLPNLFDNLDVRDEVRNANHAPKWSTNRSYPVLSGDSDSDVAIALSGHASAGANFPFTDAFVRCRLRRWVFWWTVLENRAQCLLLLVVSIEKSWFWIPANGQPIQTAAERL